MTRSDVTALGPGGHALLMAWITKEAIKALGEIPADDLLRLAVRRYGNERGARMAQRATAHDHPLDWTSYIAYGEWTARDHPHEVETVSESPQLHRRVHRCPWNDAWNAKELSRYGRYYCREIDRAIVQGFNPELELSVSQTLPSGDPCCEFVHIGYALEQTEQSRLASLTAQIGNSAVMPWSYHLGHLYWTMLRAFEAHTGAAGIAMAERGLAQFAECFGATAADLVRSYADVDFELALVSEPALDDSVA